MDTKKVESRLKADELMLAVKQGKSSVWSQIRSVASCEEGNDKRELPFVACKNCLKCFKYESHATGTTHLFRHLEKCNGAPRSKQLTLPFKKAKVTDNAKKRVLKAAAEMVVRDLRPFSSVEWDGMMVLAQSLIDFGATFGKVPACEVMPDRRKVSSYVKEWSDSERQNLLASIKTAIHNNGGIGITTDLWTENYRNQTFLSCTVHWIEAGKLFQNTLFCKLFKLSKKTGDNIKTELTSNLSELGIEYGLLKNLIFVTDRGANIKKALEGFSWLPCCCHVLNTVLYHAFRMRPSEDDSCRDEDPCSSTTDIESVTSLLNAVKDLVTYLKQSGISSQLSTSVIQEVQTRWNTKLAVLVSVSKVFPEIQSILNAKGVGDKLENMNTVLMQDIIALLSPFKSISNAMECDKYPTIHGVLLWRNKLLTHCQPKFSDSMVIKHLKTNLDLMINEKWQILDTYKIALFLFPKFKSLRILGPNEGSHVQALVCSVLEEDALHSGSERSSLHQDDHCYQESKRSKTDYALDLDDYADVDHDLDEISKYVGSNFSSMEYHPEGCIGGFDVINFGLTKVLRFLSCQS